MSAELPEALQRPAGDRPAGCPILQTGEGTIGFTFVRTQGVRRASDIQSSLIHWSTPALLRNEGPQGGSLSRRRAEPSTLLLNALRRVIHAA